MTKSDLFSNLKPVLKAISGIKNVALWNNQPANEPKENAFLYPAVFLEFMPTEYRPLLNGVQEYDQILRLHICFESYKDEDITILDLTQEVFKAVHFWQNGYDTKLIRVAEEPNYDHDNVQDFMQDYAYLGKDFAADKRPTTNATVTDDIDGQVILFNP